MTVHRTRALAAVALVAACAWVGGSPRVAVAGTGEAASAWIPADSLGVFVINVERFRKSPNYKKAMSFLRSKPEVEKSMTFAHSELGIDPDRDVKTVLGVLGKDDSKGGTLIIEAAFAPARLRKVLTRGAKSSAARHGIKAWTFADGTAVAVIGSHIVLGDSAGVEQVIDVSRGKQSGVASKPWYRAQKRHVDTGKDAWLVMSLPAGVRALAMADVKGLAGSFDVARGLALDLRFPTGGPSAASTLEGQMRLGLTLASKEAPLAAIAKKVHIGVSGADVEFRVSLSHAELKAIAGLMSAAGAL